MDFVLEGLCAQRKISRSDGGGGYEAIEKPRPPVQPSEPAFDPRRPMPRGGNKKKYYN